MTNTLSTASSAGDHLRALCRLREAGRLSLTIDLAYLNQMDSPVHVEADSNIFVYAFLAAAIFAWWARGWQLAAGISVLGVVVYFTLARFYVYRRLKKRVMDKALTDITLWQKLWGFGGVTLILTEGTPCQAPKGNWMALVRELAGGADQ